MNFSETAIVWYSLYVWLLTDVYGTIILCVQQDTSILQCSFFRWVGNYLSLTHKIYFPQPCSVIRFAACNISEMWPNSIPRYYASLCELTCNTCVYVLMFEETWASLDISGCHTVDCSLPKLVLSWPFIPAINGPLLLHYVPPHIQIYSPNQLCYVELRQNQNWLMVEVARVGTEYSSCENEDNTTT